MARRGGLGRGVAIPRGPGLAILLGALVFAAAEAHAEQDLVTRLRALRALVTPSPVAAIAVSNAAPSRSFDPGDQVQLQLDDAHIQVLTV